MNVFRSTAFWISFSAAMLASLLIGGLLSATLEKCPAFGWLLLISVGVALLGGFFGNWLLGKCIGAAVEAPRLQAQPDIEGIKQRVTEIKRRLGELGTGELPLAQPRFEVPAAEFALPAGPAPAFEL